MFGIALVGRAVGGGLLLGALSSLAPSSAAADEAPGVSLTQPVRDVRVVPTTAVPVSAAPAAVARAPESTAALARRLGLTHQDEGSSVLMTQGMLRVRVYPGTHVISFDGQDRTLRGLMARGPQGVTLPGPAVSLIETRVGQAASARAAADAAAKSAASPTPAASKSSALKPLKLAPLPELVSGPAPAPANEPAATLKPDAAWEVAGNPREWRWIVLHHSDDVCGNLDKYHRVHLDKGWEHGCGYHFVIGNGTKSSDGQVEVSQRWKRQLHGAHAKTPDNLFNDHGIGICLVGDFERGSNRPSAAQMRALIRLTQYLLNRYNLPVSAVRGHCHCKATCCPGKNFPWAELKAGLRQPAGLAATAAAAPAPESAPCLAQAPGACGTSACDEDPLAVPPALAPPASR